MTQSIVSARAWFELFLLGLIWGAGFLTVKIALGELSFVTLVAHRVFWAALALWLYVLIRRFPIPRDPRIWGAFLVMGLLNNVIPFTLMTWGQNYIEAGLTSVFNAATAIFGVLVAAIFLADERLSARKLTGVVIGFLGVAITIGIDALLEFDIRSLAQFAVLAGTLSYAFASVWAKLRLNQLRPEIAAAGMLSASAMIALPAAFIIDGMPDFTLSASTIAATGFLSLVATAAAYLLYYRIIAMAGAANTMLVTLIIPPVSILLGAWVLHETLAPRVFLGLMMLAIGLLLIDGRILRLRKPR